MAKKETTKSELVEKTNEEVKAPVKKEEVKAEVKTEEVENKYPGHNTRAFRQ